MSQLILLRHGRSIWNEENLFTGWVDIPLSEEGIQESLKAGKKIADIPIDVIFTSTLIRAQMTVPLALMHHKSKKIPVFVHKGEGRLDDWGHVYNEDAQKKLIPVFVSEALNERMYGKLQGFNKAEMAKKYGPEQIHLWRRSFDERPPEGESLAMTAARTVPYFEQTIVPILQKGQNVFIAAHGNSLRAILMHIENLDKTQVMKLELATGEPVIYSYDQGKWDALSR